MGEEEVKAVMGVQNMTEVIEALKQGMLLAKDILKDKKVDLMDLPKLMVLVQKQDVLVAAVEGIDQIPLEIKDLTLDELAQVGMLLISAIKEVKAA